MAALFHPVTGTLHVELANKTVATSDIPSFYVALHERFQTCMHWEGNVVLSRSKCGCVQNRSYWKGRLCLQLQSAPCALICCLFCFLSGHLRWLSVSASDFFLCTCSLWFAVCLPAPLDMTSCDRSQQYLVPIPLHMAGTMTCSSVTMGSGCSPCAEFGTFGRRKRVFCECLTAKDLARTIFLLLS
jgi:hypothetical protein